MIKNTSSTIERIIGKIDNDFNPDQSDWIPRVAAWVIDAMQQLDVLRTDVKRQRLKVTERFCRLPCPVSDDNLKVYKQGCAIERLSEAAYCPSTGGLRSEASTSFPSHLGELTPDTADIIITGRTRPADAHAVTINSKNEYDTKVMSNVPSGGFKHNYVYVEPDGIELNFNTDYIIVEYPTIKEVYSDIWGCSLPVVPNNGILIEAITYYCMYKMLCRGYKHPVFNLATSQYGTNPYYMWNTMKEEAKRSIINQGVDGDDSSKLFRSALFIDTFDPRR